MDSARPFSSSTISTRTSAPLLLIRAATVPTAQLGSPFPALSFNTARIDQSETWTAALGAINGRQRDAQTVRPKPATA